MAQDFAKKGWHFAQKQQALHPGHRSGTKGTHSRNYSTVPSLTMRPTQSNSTARRPGVNQSSKHTQTNSYSCRSDSKSLIALMTGDVESFPPRLFELREKLTEFMRDCVLPKEKDVLDHQMSSDRWTPLPFIEELKVNILYSHPI